jgi:N-acetylmuramoyl-L-alanine amidase
MKQLLRNLSLLAVLALGSVAHGASFRTVVIDAGHGGQDLGGSWGKVYEKHLALDTAARLEVMLRRMGYQTVMTRRSDEFITLPGRVATANSTRNAIFVSIHYNYTWKKDVSGLETFYYNENGKKLATYVQDSILRYTRSVDRNAKFARYYVIRHTNMPSILVEGGFLNNTVERNRIKSAYFRDSVARGIADGIQKYRRAG